MYGVDQTDSHGPRGISGILQLDFLFAVVTDSDVLSPDLNLELVPPARFDPARGPGDFPPPLSVRGPQDHQVGSRYEAGEVAALSIIAHRGPAGPKENPGIAERCVPAAIEGVKLDVDRIRKGLKDEKNIPD